MKVGRRALAALLAAVILTVLLPPAAMRAENAETVRVGLFPLGNFQNVDDQGGVYGYNVEYLENVSKYTHWNLEYVQCKNWVEATELLESGAIDLLAPAQKIASLEERFDYAVYSMGTEFAAVYTRADRDDLLFEDFTTMAGLKYGGAENSTFTAKFLEDYSVRAGFEPDLTLYPDTTALFDALYSGEVDAVVTNIMFAGEGVKLLGRFHPMPVYYITRKDNAKLLEQLDDAMTSIRLTTPSLEAELMAEYFPVFNSTQFTYEELQFIENSPEIVIGYEDGLAPLSYTEEGEFSGIGRRLLDEVAAGTGLRFRYEQVPEGEFSEEWLREKGICVLAGVEYNDLNLKNSRLILSMPYLETEKVIVARNGMVADPEKQITLAVYGGHSTLPAITRESFPNVSLVEYNSVEKCFEAVRLGNADALMQNRYVVEPYLSKPVYSSMGIVPMQSMEEKLCLSVIRLAGVPESEQLSETLFLRIIDKAIKQISPRAVNNIIIHSTAENRYELTLGDALYQYRFTIIAIAVLLSACIGLLLHAGKQEADKNETLRVKNEQLSAAIEQAERANASKSQFLSRMSHEIRTPMNAVVGLTAIARLHREDPEAVEDYLGKIETSSKVLLGIINDVLDMSAIESNKLKIARTEFDIKTVLTGISTIYYSQCRQKGIKFVMATDISNEALIGDSMRLNQILMNLVSNAFKFTPPGGEIQILTKETAHKDKKVFLRFVVSDTGVGISEDMQARLFKPFEQESSSTAQKHGGSGLGLSIAKNLVDMMQGAISVKSRKGEGTTFTVDIPFESSGHQVSANEGRLKDIRVLVVDDDSNAREYTTIILDRIGVEYDVATSGEEALNMLRDSFEAHRCYDICFIDWRMPGMDGVELTRRVRRMFSRDTVIIIVSAFDLSEVEDEAKSAGADLFIPKPMFQSTMFDLLMSLSGGRYTNRTAEDDSYDFTGHKVLLAEDNFMNREIAVELLHIVHMEADCAEDGRAALNMFTSSEPGAYDAILMDIQMPEMDGHEAARAIRASAHPEAQTIPIYAMTANAFMEDVSAALSAGMNGHIAKPIDTEILYETLRECVEKNKAGSRSRKENTENG